MISELEIYVLNDCNIVFSDILVESQLALDCINNINLDHVNHQFNKLDMHLDEVFQKLLKLFMEY